jgi:hypothetical protein
MDGHQLRKITFPNKFLTIRVYELSTGNANGTSLELPCRERVAFGENNMISNNCDFKVFVEEIKHRDYPDIICLAEQESVSAWRMAQKLIRRGSLGHQESMKYAETLKELIFFLRNGIRPRESSKEDLELFEVVCRDLLRRRCRSRCADSH